MDGTSGKSKEDRINAGLTEFLMTLTDVDVRALLKTTTAGMVTKDRKEDMIVEMLKFSDAPSILDRKRVLKEYLVKYLSSKKVKLDLKNATKTKLCRMVLDHWEWRKEEEMKGLRFLEPPPKPPVKSLLPVLLPDPDSNLDGRKRLSTENKEDCKALKQSRLTTNTGMLAIKASGKAGETDASSSKVTSTSDLLKLTTVASKGAALSLSASKSADDDKQKLSTPIVGILAVAQSTKQISSEENETVVDGKPTSAAGKENKSDSNAATGKSVQPTTAAKQTDSDADKESITVKTFCETGTNTDICMIVSNISCEDEDLMDYAGYVSLRRQEQERGQALGIEFAGWFYDKLNRMSEFDPSSHFWSDCNVQLECISQNVLQKIHLQEVLHNGDKSCELLWNLRCEKQFMFCPNFNGGIRGKINPHGLAQILVSGTLHNLNKNVVGCFEQVFGLMQDPLLEKNNFKIKFSLLRLREGHLSITSDGEDSTAVNYGSTLVGIIDDEEESMEMEIEDDTGVDCVD